MRPAAGTLIVSQYNPRAVFKTRALVLVLWLVSIALTYLYCKATMAPGYSRTQQLLAESRTAVLASQTTVESLKSDVARFQRGEQVAKEASVALQKSLDERQVDLASLRSDLSFFQRFSGGGNPLALGVQSIAIKPTNNPSVFAYVIALSQNLKRGNVASGDLSISVSGVLQGKVRQVDLGQLVGEGQKKRIKYSFKYFQRFDGTLVLPEGFMPSSIRARMVNDNGEAADKEVTWEAASKAVIEQS